MPTSTRFQMPIQHLNDNNTTSVKSDLLGLADRIDADELHLDLARVDSVSSAGLSLVIALHRRLVAARKRLVLCNVRDEVGHVLRLTRLDTLLDVRSA